MKIGIVCEGGGMRGAFTAGVLQTFMENGFVADELVGVSAGASNGASYVSGQQGRGMRTNLNYCNDKRYASWGNYLRTGSVFGMDFVFGEIPEKLDPFDYDAFYASPCDYYAGATEIDTGKIVFFGKRELTPGCAILRASCSIPMLAPIVEYNGHQYLDGGVAAPIPIEKALADGCDKLIVILTRDRAYRKKAQSMRPVYHAVYRHHPGIVRALDLRHLVYNHTLEQLARLEEEGKAIVIAPDRPLEVSRLGKDYQQLADAYHLGLASGLEGLARL